MLPTKSQIDDIQILRAFAVILVVIQHVPINLVDWHAPWAQLIILHFGGDLGVDLFLVISGVEVQTWSDSYPFIRNWLSG